MDVGWTAPRLERRNSLMFNYERHLIVVLAIAVVVVLAAVTLAFLEVPIPFFNDTQ